MLLQHQGEECRDGGATGFITYDNINESITATTFDLVLPGPDIRSVMVTLNVGNFLIADPQPSNVFPKPPLSVYLAVANVPEPSTASLFLLMACAPAARVLARKRRVWTSAPEHPTSHYVEIAVKMKTAISILTNN